MTFIPQTEQVSTIDSDWPSEAWGHSTGLNTTGSGSGSGFSNFQQSRTGNGGSASLGSFGNNQDPFQSHLLSVGNSAEQSRPHQHCTTGKSFSEALFLASTNPQYDDRLFIQLRVQYMKIASSEHTQKIEKQANLA